MQNLFKAFSNFLKLLSVKITDNNTKTALDRRFYQPLTIPESLAAADSHLPRIRLDFMLLLRAALGKCSIHG